MEMVGYNSFRSREHFVPLAGARVRCPWTWSYPRTWFLNHAPFASVTEPEWFEALLGQDPWLPKE